MTTEASAPSVARAIARLRRDFESLRRSNNPQLAVSPSSHSMLEWHFVLHSLPEDTPYHGGCYHGKVIFPPLYPNAPPSIVMLTPSGRLDVNRKLCLSMTDFHPESWNPAWSVETILVGLLSFMISGDHITYGAVRESEERRRQLAQESWGFNAKSAAFVELFPELMDRPTASSSSSAAAVAPETATEVQAGPSASVADSLATPLTGVQIEDPQPPESQDDADDVPAECWICRDGSSDEPLIQPCVCRGSMSGVHASCVEGWIRHHRQNATNDAPPTCMVCNQPYSGSEQRPGPAEYARHLCVSCLRTSAWCIYRLAIFLAVLFCYLLGVGTMRLDIHNSLPIPYRIVLITMCILYYSRKVLVLTVSLPRNRLPPTNRFLGFFYVTNQHELVTDLLELANMVYILGILFGIGSLPLLYFLPFLFAYLVLAFRNARHLHRAAMRAPQQQGLRQLVPTCFRHIWQHRRRIFSPVTGLPHVVVSLVAVLLGIFRDSGNPTKWDTALLVLFGTHSFVLMFGVVEHACFRRIRWRKGISWVVAVYFAMVACLFTTGEMPRAVCNLSIFWMLLQCALAISVNWRLWMRRARAIRAQLGVQRWDVHYRMWQNRHGTFVLNGSGDSNPQLEPQQQTPDGGSPASGEAV